jgi:hypothetical protein
MSWSDNVILRAIKYLGDQRVKEARKRASMVVGESDSGSDCEGEYSEAGQFDLVNDGLDSGSISEPDETPMDTGFRDHHSVRSWKSFCDDGPRPAVGKV